MLPRHARRATTVARILRFAAPDLNLTAAERIVAPLAMLSRHFHRSLAGNWSSAVPTSANGNIMIAGAAAARISGTVRQPSIKGYTDAAARTATSHDDQPGARFSPGPATRDHVRSRRCECCPGRSEPRCPYPGRRRDGKAPRRIWHLLQHPAGADGRAAQSVVARPRCATRASASANGRRLARRRWVFRLLNTYRHRDVI